MTQTSDYMIFIIEISLTVGGFEICPQLALLLLLQQGECTRGCAGHGSKTIPHLHIIARIRVRREDYSHRVVIIESQTISPLASIAVISQDAYSPMRHSPPLTPRLLSDI